jgi:hypothetical protein
MVGKNHQPVLIDQAVLDQRLDQLATALDQQVTAGRGPQLGDLGHDVTPDHRGFAPSCLVIGQRRSHHILLGMLFIRWPNSSEPIDG